VDVKVKWNGKMGFTAVGPSGHEVFMDAGEQSGGDDKGPRPTEVALAAIGGCSGIDVIWMMDRMRQDVDDLAMHITTERAEEEPRRFTRIHVHYTLTGHELDESRVERAIRLTKDKYCSVSNSFNAEITTSYEIVESQRASED